MKTKNNILFIFIIFCIITSGCAHNPFCKPFDNWSKSDTVRQSVYTGLHIIDWGQTLNISKNPDKYCEIGLPKPIYGKHPSVDDVNFFCGTTLIIQTIIPSVLKPKYRKAYQYLWIGGETVTTFHNFQIGLHINF